MQPPNKPQFGDRQGSKLAYELAQLLATEKGREDARAALDQCAWVRKACWQRYSDQQIEAALKGVGG